MDRLHDAMRLFVWSLVVAWGLSSLWYPFGWDQGIFAWVADTMLGGGMPYRDAFDLKGPASYLPFALAQLVFGHNEWGIRILDLVGITVAAWIVARAVSRYTAPGVGQWAGALLIFWYAGLTFWHTAQPDGFAAMLLTMGFVPLLHERDGSSWKRALGAGAALGLAISIKPNYAVFLLVPAIVYFAGGKDRPMFAGGRLGLAGLGALAVVGAFLAWFAAAGALDELFEVHLAYNASIYSSGSSLAIGQRLEGLFDYILTGNVFVVVLPAALIGAVALHRIDRVATYAVATWALLAIATVVLQNKFFDYQWAPLFPPMAILGVVGLHAAVTRDLAAHDDTTAELTRPSKGLALALCAVLFVHSTVHPAFEVLNWASFVAGVRDEQAYHDTFGVPGNDLRMVEHIRRTSRPEHTLFIMAWNAEILYATGRNSVSRFGYSLPFWMGEGTDLQARYRSEVMGALVAEPPDLIVVATQAVPLVGRVAALEEFPEFVRFLDGRYDEDVTFGDLVLYRHR